MCLYSESTLYPLLVAIIGPSGWGRLYLMGAFHAVTVYIYLCVALLAPGMGMGAAQMLLESGADPNAESSSGQSPLLYAYDYWLRASRDPLKRLVALKAAKDIILLLLNVRTRARACAAQETCHTTTARL